MNSTLLSYIAYYSYELLIVSITILGLSGFGICYFIAKHWKSGGD